MTSEELIEKEANERYPDRPVVLGRGNTCLSCGEVQRDAFKAGVEWARQNPEYKPMLVEYDDAPITGQPCELCPFHDITNAEYCASLFEKRFGGKCTIFGVRFAGKSLA